MRFPVKASIVVLFALAAIPAVARADLANGYVMQSYSIIPDGQFTACNGQIHYWSNSYCTTGERGYNIYDVATNTTTTVGLPPNGVLSNGYGDCFGVLDSTTNVFYAGTYKDYNASYVYQYDRATGIWNTEATGTTAGVFMVNAYGAQAHNGQLYVAGLAEPWNGGYGQDNYIFAYDHSATPGGDAPRHDTLIQTSGNSANVAVAPNGDVYYGTFSNNTLYRWTAAQVAGVTNDLYADEEDTFLTLADAQTVLAMPGAGNGVAVDAGGNVFFAVNSSEHILGMVDPSAPNGYREIYTSDNYMDWFGPISVDGDFCHGGTLYLSPSTFGGTGIVGIQQMPEPGAVVLLGSALAFALVARRWRRSRRIFADATLIGNTP